MIFLTKHDEYSVRYPLDICLDFVQKFIREGMALGWYELEKGIYCSAVAAPLKKSEEFFFEAHRKYADLHCVLEGTQCMWVGDTCEMEFLGYTEEKDFVKVLGEPQAKILQTPGTAVAVFPEDAHTLDPEYLPEEVVKKIVFKIPLELFK